MSNGPLSYRPRSASRQSDPSMGFNMNNGLSSNRPRSMSRHSDPSMGINLDIGTSSPPRPHSLSHNSDPGDPRYLKNTRDLLVPTPSLYHAVSTPDLRSSVRESSFMYHHQPLPAKDMNYHYGDHDYHSASRAYDFTTRPEREVEGRLVSRSLSDLSNLANDTGYFSYSPTAIPRTFVHPSYESAPPYGKTFYLQSDESPGTYHGEYRIRSSGNVPDLSASFPPFRPPYPTSRNDRASPTPSQYSDYSSHSSSTTGSSPRGVFISPRSPLSENSFSPNESGYGTRENDSAFGLRGYERSSLRDYLRSNLESPSGFRRSQSPSLSRLPRSVDYSSPLSNIPTYNSTAQQSSLLEEDLTRRSDAGRTCTDRGRETSVRERSSTLTRTMSLSNLGEEKKQFIPTEAQEKRRDSLPLSVDNHREKYPLAKVPIPSFREFKQKNLERDSKNDTLGETKKAKEERTVKSPRTGAKHETKGNADMRSTLKERLSSLYESAKDISAQNTTKRFSETYKMNSSGNVKIEESICVAKSTDLTKAKRDTYAAKMPRKVSKDHKDSPFSKNEVIHQLMLKYGLYEKGGQKKSRSLKNERKDILSHSVSADLNDRRNENESKSKISPGGKEKLKQEGDKEKNWRNSIDHSSNRSTPIGSPLSPRKSIQGISGETKKSAAERFRELRRKNGVRNDIVESTSKVKSTEVHSTVKTAVEMDTVAVKNSPQNDLDSSVADMIRAKTLAVKSKMAKEEVYPTQSEDLSQKPSSNTKKNSFSLRGTSRAVLCASKFKKAAKKELKTPDGSPLPNRKQLEEILCKSDEATKVTSQEPEKKVANTPPMYTINTNQNETFDRASPNTRRRRFRGDRSLQRGGIHTSMLSVASSACSDTEMDDSVSIYNEMDSLDDERGTRGRRWESFHSNISADSGSAHLFEFETDSNLTEYDEVFDDQDSGGETLSKHHEISRTATAMVLTSMHDPMLTFVT